MIERDMHQIVLPPGTDQATIEKVTAKVDALESQGQVSNWTKVRIVIAHVLHPVGVHFWVRWVSYDAATDRLIDTGMTCRFCPLARLQ